MSQPSLAQLEAEIAAQSAFVEPLLAEIGKAISSTHELDAILDLIVRRMPEAYLPAVHYGFSRIRRDAADGSILPRPSTAAACSSGRPMATFTA